MTDTTTPPTPAATDHTQREIRQQPRLWREITNDLEPADHPARQWLRLRLLDRQTRIVLTGAGTSALVGDIAAPYLRRTSGRRVEAVATTDIVSAPAVILSEDVPTLLVSVARSGNSPESLAATTIASEALTTCWHLVITCDASGDLATAHLNREDSLVVNMPLAANDQGLAMTSSFTSMLLAVLLLLGDHQDGEPSSVERIARCAEHVLQHHSPSATQLLAANEAQNPGIVYLAGTALRGVADESALKVLELTAGQVRSSSDATLAFRHGPKATLSQQPLVVIYISNDPYSRLYDLDMLREILSEQPSGTAIAITANPADLPEEAVYWELPGLGNLPDAFVALPAVICAQLIATAWSTSLHLNPDNPYPTGKVNRVVKGVIVHPHPPTRTA